MTAPAVDSPATESPWMFAKEAAAHARCHYKTVLRAHRAGKLRGVQNCPGGKLRFHRDDVDAWMRGETQPVKRRGPRRLHKVG